MNNRLNIQDIALLLAERVDRDKADTELFLRALIEEVTEGVCADHQVKVRGLGTFKVILVEERESVHVNTGERFLIPAHPKFTFLPDKELREQVNRPFSIFETTELNDGVTFSDIEEPAETEPAVTPIETAEPPQPVPVPVAESEPEPESGSVEPARVPVSVAPVAESLAEPVARSEEVSTSQRERWILAAVICGLMAVVAAVFFYIGRNNWHPAPVAPAMEEPLPVPSLPVDSMRMNTLSVRTDSAHVELDSVASSRPVSLGEERIRRGDRLTEFALKYYGSKLFWVYIYQHNKSVIEDPNNVPIGTRIELPAPELYGIDAKSRASREKAAALQREILTKE